MQGFASILFQVKNTVSFEFSDELMPEYDEVERPAYFDSVCIACHAVGGAGGNVGPALDGVAHRMSAEELDRWLADPQSVKPGTAMPMLGLSDDVRSELVTWLGTLE